MSSGVEARIALDVAVVLSLGTTRLLGGAGALTAAGAEALAALAAGRAEQRAAALAEVQRQHDALHQVIDRLARLAVLAEAAERHGADIALPEALDPTGHTPDELTAWCAEADPALEEAERRISEHIAASVVAQTFTAFAPPADVPRRRPTGRTAEQAADAGSISGAAPGGRTTERAVGAGSASGAAPGGRTTEQTAGAASGGGAGDAGRRAALGRVVGRLLPDTADEDVRHVAEAAERLGGARTDGEAEGLLSEVRLRVQRANRRTAERQAAQARAKAEREAAEQARAERAYVLDAVRGAFGELGYEVEEGFETLTAQDGTVLLTRDGWPEHAVKLRVDEPNTLRAALVRTEEPRSEEDRRRDVEREAEWCAAFEAARDRLVSKGVASDVRWQLDPGEQRLPVEREARQTRKNRREQQRQREVGRGGA